MDQPGGLTSEIVAESYTSGLLRVNFYAKGEMLDTAGGTASPAQHLLVETDDLSWSSDSDRTLTLRITPKVPSIFVVKIRGWVCAREYDDCSTISPTAIPPVLPFSMTTPRTNHAMVSLADGKVLVVGGRNQGVDLGSTEIYDPTTGAWSPKANTDNPRSFHTATTFTDGTVLATGGFGGGSALVSAEVYAPVPDGWTAAAGMAQARFAHTATLLEDGRVLVVGGWDLETPLASTEVYMWPLDRWRSDDPMTANRRWHTSTLLADGNVLVAGGLGEVGQGEGALASAEEYKPALRAWSPTEDMTKARYRHTATALGDGTVLVVGGTGETIALASTELYDPASGQWIATPSLSVPRYFHTATLLADGRVLVAGGWKDIALASAEVYDPITGTWSATQPMVKARYHHTAVLLADGSVLVADGQQDKEGAFVLASAEVYDLATGGWASQ